jgi:hypothetical protein
MSTTVIERVKCGQRGCRCHEIEFPTHCPLCHKFMGKDVCHAVMPNATVVCVHCYRLEQIETLEMQVIEMPEWLVRLRDLRESARDLIRCWRPSYRRARRKMFAILGEMQADALLA